LRNYKVIGAKEEIMKTASDSFFKQFVEWMNSETIDDDEWIPVSVRLPIPEESTDKYRRFWVTAMCPDEDGKFQYSVHVSRRVANGFDMEKAGWLAEPIAWKPYSEPEPFIPQSLEDITDVMLAMAKSYSNSPDVDMPEDVLQAAATLVQAEFQKKGNWYIALMESIAQYLRTIPANEGLYSVAEGLADRIAGVESDQDSIDTLGLTVRTYVCLKRAGINSVSQLRNIYSGDLREITNLDYQDIDEITEKLESMIFKKGDSHGQERISPIN
jgi:hypothetical protein